MKVKYLMMTLLMSVVVLISSFDVHAAVLTSEVPDFETYLELSGLNIDDYSYYYIGVYPNFNKDSSLGVCDRWYIVLTNSPQHMKYTSDSSYYGYTTFYNTDVFCFGSIYTDDSGKVLKYTFTNSTNGNTTHDFYFWSEFQFMYSNYNVLMINDDIIETVFLVAPYSQGQKVTIGTTISHQTISNSLMKQILFLVPLVISLLVFSTGLRKALRMLSALLRPA